MPARGGPPRQIAATGSKPAWSPDGRRIAFQTDEHADMSPVGFGAQSGSTIAIVNADGTGVRAMTRAGQPIGGHAAPAWSPDGRFLAFTVFDNGAASGLWLGLDRVGRPDQVVAGAKLYEAAFAPDGSSIYAAGGGDAFISRIPFDAQKGSAAGPQTLMPIAGVPGVRGLSISRDGRRLWLSGVSLSSQLYSQSIDSAGTPVGRAVALTDDTSRRNSLPAISPDGSKVAYMSSRRGERPNVWLMDIDGGNPVQLTADETADNHPRWLPDGRRVAFLSVRDGEGGIWAIDVTTRREERLFDMTAAARPAEERRVRGALGEIALAPSMTRAAFSLLAPPYGHRALTSRAGSRSRRAPSPTARCRLGIPSGRRTNGTWPSKSRTAARPTPASSMPTPAPCASSRTSGDRPGCATGLPTVGVAVAALRGRFLEPALFDIETGARTSSPKADLRASTCATPSGHRAETGCLRARGNAGQHLVGDAAVRFQTVQGSGFSA